MSINSVASLHQSGKAETVHFFDLQGEVTALMTKVMSLSALLSSINSARSNTLRRKYERTCDESAGVLRGKTVKVLKYSVTASLAATAALLVCGHFASLADRSVGLYPLLHPLDRLAELIFENQGNIWNFSYNLASSYYGAREEAHGKHLDAELSLISQDLQAQQVASSESLRNLAEQIQQLANGLTLAAARG